MENAGRQAADFIAKKGLAVASAGRRGRTSGRQGRVSAPVCIVCGRGNNGGDGFVIARHLALRGFEVSVDLFGEAGGLSADAGVNGAIVRNMGLPVRAIDTPRQLAAAARRWQRCGVLVDALLGTGFAGEVRAPLAEVIRRINALRGPVIVAVDVPSGLNADTGEPGGAAVEADYTVTFVAEKVGFARPGARRYVGRVAVADIGAPRLPSPRSS